MYKRTLTLVPRPPYDFELTMEYLISFQGAARVDLFEDGRYQRLFDLNGKLLLAQVRSIGAVEGPKLEVTVQGHQMTDEDVAAAMESGTLDLEGLRNLTDDQVAEMLLALQGVGRWTVQWMLIRALGRLDAFPSGDLALQRVISRFYFQGRKLTEHELEEFSQGWSPWRSLFTTYLFAAMRRGLVEV